MRRQKNGTGPENLQAAERRAEALALRRGGMTLDAIGQRLGVSGVAIHGYLKAELSKLRAECHDLARIERDLDLQRLDCMFGPFYAKALSGDPQAVDRCLKIMERKARLLGMDAPDRALVGIAPVAETMTLERLVEVRRLVYGESE